MPWTSLWWGRPTPPLGVQVLIFFQFDHSCIQTLRVQVEPIIDKNMLMLCFSSLKLRHVDGVLMWIFRVYPPSTRSPSLTFAHPEQTIKLSLGGSGIVTMHHISRVPCAQQSS